MRKESRFSSSARAILLFGSVLSLGACAAVTSEEYFAVGGGSDRKARSWPGDVNTIYSRLKADVAILEREGLRFRLTVEDRGEYPILFGVVLPVVPLFIAHVWETPLRSDHLSLRLDVGGVILASRPVRVRFDEIELRTIAGKEPRGPLRVTGQGKHGLLECPTREVDLPSSMFSSGGLDPRPSLFSLGRRRERFYTFRLEYGPGTPQLDSLEFLLGGVTVGNKDLESVRVVFSRRRDWEWVLFGL